MIFRPGGSATRYFSKWKHEGVWEAIGAAYATGISVFNYEWMASIVLALARPSTADRMDRLGLCLIPSAYPGLQPRLSCHA